MIDRIALIVDLNAFLRPAEYPYVLKQEAARQTAREILLALRDPTPEMINEGRKNGAQFPLEAWQAMIDEVLK